MVHESIREVNEENPIPAFLYSGILGLHFFVDTFSVRGSDLDQFIDKIVQAIKLMRGVRVCFTGWWEVLTKSEIRDLLQFGDGDIEHTDEYVEQLLALPKKLPEIAGIYRAEVDVLLEAVRQLKWVYTSSLLILQKW